MGSREHQAFKEGAIPSPTILPASGSQGSLPFRLVGLDSEGHGNLRHECAQDLGTSKDKALSFCVCSFCSSFTMFLSQKGMPSDPPGWMAWLVLTAA